MNAARKREHGVHSVLQLAANELQKTRKKRGEKFQA